MKFERIREELEILINRQDDNFLNDIEWYGSQTEVEKQNRQQIIDFIARNETGLTDEEVETLFNL